MRTKKINIVTDNYGSSTPPVLATFSKKKAKAKYLEIIQRSVYPTDRIGKDFTEHTYRVKRAKCDGIEYIEINGQWYSLIDIYGDKIASWFELDVE